MNEIENMMISNNLVDSLRNFKHISKLCEGKTILDMGCGLGQSGYFLVNNGIKSYTGIDINEKLIRYANSHFASEKAIFKVADACSFKSKDKFDVVLSFEVIEHLDDYRTYIKNARRMLKDDGLLILTTPDHEATLRCLNRTPIFHKHEFIEKEIRKELEKYFEIVEFRGLGDGINPKLVMRLEIIHLLGGFVPYFVMEDYLDKNIKNVNIKDIKKLNFDKDYNNLFFIVCRVKN